MVWIAILVIEIGFGAMILATNWKAVKSKHDIVRINEELTQLKTEVARLKAKLGEK